MVSYSRKPPKYYCTICNKGFRRNKQYYNHVNNAHRNLGTNTKQVEQIVIEPELVSLKPEIEHTEPSIYENQYYGREYKEPGVITGNRHLRAGIPFATDPQRRTIQPKVLPKSMPSLGPMRTLSKHKYGLQAI